MVSSPRFLAALLVAIVALPQPHSLAKSRPLRPDLVVVVDVFTPHYLCVGPSLLRLLLPVSIRNAGKAAAVNPSPWTQWIEVRDKVSGPPWGVTWSQGDRPNCFPDKLRPTRCSRL
jgi:hypothetical protein